LGVGYGTIQHEVQAKPQTCHERRKATGVTAKITAAFR